MEDLCSGCLSTGRKLNFIGDMDYYYIFAQIMNEIPQVYEIPPSCIRLCWECRGHLNSFHRFKQRAVNCLTDLVQHAPLVCCSSISLYVQHILEYPEGQTAFDASPEVRVKCEWEHCEPEAFADCVDVTVKPEDDDEQPLKKKKKEPKLKTSKDKVKVKKKRKKKQAIDNDIDHDDPIDNEPIHDEPIDNDPIDMDPMGNGDSKDIDIEDTFSKNIDENVRNEIEIKKESNDLVKKGIKKIIVKKVAVPLSTDGSERPQCQECGKVFSSKKTYRYHLNVLHKGQNRYPCPRCGKVYQWKSNLGRHMRSHKAVDDGELHCSVCDKSFASVATYRQHLRLSRSHVPEEQFSFACDSCGKRFVNKTRLRDHIDWEHLHRIKFRCQLCNKPFKCQTSLYVHTQNVHVGKERKDNLCHVCGKSYQNAAKLKYHITAMHSGETPYRCSHSHCRAAFGWYSSLYRHVREVHYKMKGVGKKAKKIKQNEEPPAPQYAPL